MGDGDSQVYRTPGAGDRRPDGPAPRPVSHADVLSAGELRVGGARPRRAERLAAGPDRAGRGAAAQELGGEDDARGQEVAQPLRLRADWHTAGEQVGGTLQ